LGEKKKRVDSLSIREKKGGRRGTRKKDQKGPPGKEKKKGKRYLSPVHLLRKLRKGGYDSG